MHLPQRWRWRLGTGGLLLALGLIALPGWAGLVDFSANLIHFVEKKWGADAAARMQVWQRLVRDSKAAAAKGRADSVSLKNVNGFFNQVAYVNDIKHWGVEDYWATPIEMLGTFGGDCEDYSIGKYLSLKESGIPIEKLRITYVRALKLGESHMVLAYYATPDFITWTANALGEPHQLRTPPPSVPVGGNPQFWVHPRRSGFSCFTAEHQAHHGKTPSLKA